MGYALLAASLLAGGRAWNSASSEAAERTKPEHVRLLVWPKRAGAANGVALRMAVDGHDHGKLSNLDEQMMLDIGILDTGIHTFRLTQLAAYKIDEEGGSQRLTPGDGSCGGTFTVQPFQSYYFTAVNTLDGKTFQCQIQ